MIVDGLHCDATLHWTHQRTEIATDTFVFIDARNASKRPVRLDATIQLWNRRERDARAARSFNRWWGGMFGAQVDALMRAVPAGDVTKLAADAFLRVNARHDFEIQVQVIPVRDLGRAQPAKILDAGEAFFAHPILESVDHVFDDAIAV